MSDAWVTKREAAAMLQMSEKTVDRMAAQGKLKRDVRLVAGKGSLPHFRRREIDAIVSKEMGRHEPGTGLVRVLDNEVASPVPQQPGTPPTNFWEFLRRVEGAGPLPPSELACKAYLTMDEAVRYTGLSAGFIRGKVTPLTGMRPFRYRREELEKL
jgi:predicted DNA-binding transcriptional regulator AlpA